MPLEFRARSQKTLPQAIVEPMFSALDAQTADNLHQAEALRAAGVRGDSLEKFAAKMRQAIAKGANRKDNQGD